MKLIHIIVAVVGIIFLILFAKGLGLIDPEGVEKVIVEKVEVRNITEIVTASGKIQPEAEVKLSSEVSGEVIDLLVREGDRVEKGQLLCRVRPDILKSGYDRATASYSAQKAAVAAAEQQLELVKGNFANAESIYKRNSVLFSQRIISAAAFDAEKAAFNSAKASLESAKQNLIAAKYTLEQSGAGVKEASASLAKATIFAPVSGVISKLSIERGDRILGTSQMAGTEIMRIANLKNMEVNVSVNENDINRVKIGNKANVEVDAFANKKFKGVVTEIATSSTTNTSSTSSSDQATNFSVKIRLMPNHDKNQANAGDISQLKPGLSATVDIESASVKGISVPIQSVFVKKDKDNTSDDTKTDDKHKGKTMDKKIKQFVYRYNNKTNKVKQVSVSTGIQNDQYIIVTSGVDEGDEIISGPYNAIQSKLKDGATVERVTKNNLFTEDDKK